VAISACANRDLRSGCRLNRQRRYRLFAYPARAGIKIWSFLTSLVPAKDARSSYLRRRVIKVTGLRSGESRGASLPKVKGCPGSRDQEYRCIESMKTMAFQIVEQLDWRAQIGLSRRSGVWSIGFAKGFEEMLALGIVDKIPALASSNRPGAHDGPASRTASAWQPRREPADRDATPLQATRTRLRTAV